MFSILNNNQFDIDLFIPLKKQKIINKIREGPGIQSLPNGITIKGNWIKNELEGESIIKFPNDNSLIKGIIKDKKLIKGTIVYENGGIVIGDFQNNGTHDFFETIEFRFSCGMKFIGKYNKNICIIEGVLLDKNNFLIKKWNGNKIVYYIDDSNSKGIIISKSRFYEGEIEDDEIVGIGNEYFPYGFYYYKYEINEKDGISRETECCFLAMNQYQSFSKFDKGELITRKKIFSNGITEKIDLKKRKTCIISFEKLNIQGYIETDSILENYNIEIKGTFYFKNMKLDVKFQHKDLKFIIIYEDNIVFKPEKFVGYLERAIEQTNSKLKSEKIKKKEDYKKYSQDDKKISKTTSSKNFEILKNNYSDIKKKSRYLVMEIKNLKEQLLDFKNRNSYLQNELDKKVEILKNFEKLEKTENLKKEKKEVKEKKIENGFFKGIIIDGKKNGFCEEYINDEYFEGYYKDDLKEGEGYIKNDIFEYKGNFVKNKFHGKGKKYFFENKKILEGEFNKGRFFNNKIIFSGFFYEGEILNGKMNGKGKLVLKDDWIFEGDFKNDEVFEEDFNGLLKNVKENVVYEVEYKFIPELKLKVFRTEKNKTFFFDQKNGLVKNLF